MTDQGGNPETPTEAPVPHGDAQSTPQGSKRKRRKRRRKHKNNEQRNRFEECFRELLQLYAKSDGDPSAITNAVSDVLTLTLGSVPSFAVGESMIAASQAQSQMLNNAVANQQRINMVSMCATAECVRQLMHVNPRYPYPVWPNGVGSEGGEGEPE